MSNLASKIIKYGSAKRKGFNTHDFNEGLYNNYEYRSDKFSLIKESLCKNYLEYNGIVFGQFYCPIEGFNEDDTKCCGIEKEQYCCGQIEYLKFHNKYQENANKTHVGLIVFIIFLVIFIILLLVGLGVLIYCLLKKHLYKQVNTD
jgi:hypothetical protein